ncbi:MAG TPA: hypothetical protein VFV78_14790 [Vicinamibacterales bacterium]|nr:hypothetical protein [Vicinamibacterales bacterium]
MAASAPLASAQVSPPADLDALARRAVGRTVRLTLADGFHRDGVVTSVGPAGIVMAFDGSAVTVPFDRVNKIENVSDAVRRGTWLGLAAGAGFAVWVSASACRDIQPPCRASTIAGGMFIYGPMGAAAGVGLGKLIEVTARDRRALFDAGRSIVAPEPAASPVTRTTSAAAVPALKPGKKVRITRSDGFEREGVVHSVTATTMNVTFGQTTVALPVDHIQGVHTLQNHIKRGVIAGLAVGGGLAGLAAAGCGSDCSGNDRAAITIIGAGFGTSIGMGIGAIVQALKPRGTQVYAAPNRTPTFAMAPMIGPARRGLVVTMTWR